MHWPDGAVESEKNFTPRFCPRHECPHHQLRDASAFRFVRRGSYSTLQHDDIPRFKCLKCRRGFSRQTFAVSYYLKRGELVAPVAAGLVAGSAHRQIARSLHCAPSTVTRLSARLGRHGLLLQARALSHLAGKIDESIVFDHFESFEFTQDYPFGVATAVGSKSWFLYAVDPAPHKRAGRLSPEQKARLERRPQRDLKGNYTKSTERLFTTLATLPVEGKPLQLLADGHVAYRRVAASFKPRFFEMRSFPNPPRARRGARPSAQARVRNTAMFPVDALHALIRHSVAHHRRETIAFGRRINALMERFFLTVAWRNFVKWRSERRPDPTTPATVLGLTGHTWNWRRVFNRRLFPYREKLPPAWDELYRRLWETPLVCPNTRHELKRAF